MTKAVAVPPLERGERPDDGGELADVVGEVAENPAGERVGEPDQRLDDGDEADHARALPSGRSRAMRRNIPPTSPAEHPLGDADEDETDQERGSDRCRRGVGAVAGDEPVGLDVGVGRVEEEVEDAADDPDDGVDDPGSEPADDHLESGCADVADEAGDLVDRPADRVREAGEDDARVTGSLPIRSKPASASSNGSGCQGSSRTAPSGVGPGVSSTDSRSHRSVGADEAHVDGEPVGLRNCDIGGRQHGDDPDRHLGAVLTDHLRLHCEGTDEPPDADLPSAGGRRGQR